MAEAINWQEKYVNYVEGSLELKGGHGDALDVRGEKEKTQKIPLSRIRAALKTINREPRGTDEEYRETIIKEYNDLNVFRERAKECPF